MVWDGRPKQGKFDKLNKIFRLYQKDQRGSLYSSGYANDPCKKLWQLRLTDNRAKQGFKSANN